LSPLLKRNDRLRPDNGIRPSRCAPADLALTWRYGEDEARQPCDLQGRSRRSSVSLACGPSYTCSVSSPSSSVPSCSSLVTTILSASCPFSASSFSCTSAPGFSLWHCSPSTSSISSRTRPSLKAGERYGPSCSSSATSSPCPSTGSFTFGARQPPSQARRRLV